MAGAKIGFGSGSTELTEKGGFAKVTLPDLIAEPSSVGAAVMASENDSGAFTGTPFLYSPESDVDYRLRVSIDTLLDSENFNYTAQNTGKFNMAATTVAPTHTLSAFNTNPTNVGTSGGGVIYRSYTTFPVLGTGTLALDVEFALSAAPVTNNLKEIGLFTPSSTLATSPIDGVFLRITSAGIQGIISYSGTEASTGIIPIAFGSGTPYSLTANKRYQFIIYVCQREVFFWVNSGAGADCIARLVTPTGFGQPTALSSMPFCVRDYNSSTATTPPNLMLSNYSVRVGGSNVANLIASNTNAFNGGYQGGSGGVIGSLLFGTVTTGSIVAPTAVVPTNTTCANTGLGGTVYETTSIASGTDAIMLSYQLPTVPTATASTYSSPRRLRITGVSLSSFCVALLTGGGYMSKWYIAFGHTAVSLQTGEAATTKAPRRVLLPFMQSVSAAQAANTLITQNTYSFTFNNPIYVNAGEFVQLVKTNIGTAASAGTIGHNIVLDYCWE
jgi:hypothetical protein